MAFIQPFWNGVPQFFDNSGQVLAGGMVYFYLAGTSTTKDTYPTEDDAQAQTNANTNPVVLDSAGRAQIWLRGQYKVILRDADDATIWTQDEIGSAEGDDSLPKGYVTGLEVSLDTDTDHDVNVTAGEARDDADSENIVLSSEITKQIDAAWAVGDDAGGLDTGSVAASTTYYVWLIKRTDTGIVDVLFSASNSAPTMPSNYDKKRLFARLKTDGDSNIAYVLSANRPVELTSDGESEGLVRLKTLTASSSSSLDFTGIDGTFNKYLLDLSDIVPATDGAIPYIRISDDGGVTFENGASAYNYEQGQIASGSFTGATATTTQISLSPNSGVGNATSEGLSGRVYMETPATAARKTSFNWFLSLNSGTGAIRSIWGNGQYQTAVATNGVQLLFSSGNIASGTVTLYGLRK